MICGTALARSAALCTYVMLIPATSFITFLPSPEATESTRSPISFEPVKWITFGTGCDAVAEPAPKYMFRMPRGTFVCMRWPMSLSAVTISLTIACEISGVRCDGFHTTVLPVTSAATTCAIGIASGKLNGVMIAATPRGLSRHSIAVPSAIFWCVAPFMLSAIGATTSTTPIASATSRWQSKSVLPISRHMIRSSSSLYCLSSSATRKKALSLKSPLIAIHSTKSRSAAFIARSTSSPVLMGVRPSSSRRLAGLTLSRKRSVSEAIHSPSM